MRRRLLGVLLHACAGCSYVFVRPPPEVVSPPEHPVDCTTSPLPAAADTLLAVAAAIGAGQYATLPSCGSSTDPGKTCVSGDERAVGIAASVAGALVWTLSAAHGSRAVRRCAAVQEDGRLCRAGDDEACRRLDPAWTPARRVVGP